MNTANYQRWAVWTAYPGARNWLSTPVCHGSYSHCCMVAAEARKSTGRRHLALHESSGCPSKVLWPVEGRGLTGEVSA